MTKKMRKKQKWMRKKHIRVLEDMRKIEGMRFDISSPSCEQNVILLHLST
jgi:hypothetical protein